MRILDSFREAVSLLHAVRIRFDALEQHLSTQITDQQVTIEWFRKRLSESRIAHAVDRTKLGQLDVRLAAAERDFEWARVRINQLEVERADLLRRILDYSPGLAAHFQVPVIEPKHAPGPPAGVASGTPLPDNVHEQIAAMMAGDIFADPRDNERDADDPLPM